MKNITTLKWLLKREIWENKVLLIWSNFVLAAAILFFTVPGIFWLGENVKESDVPSDLQINEFATQVSHYFTSGLILFSILLVLTMYSYATAAFIDERKDRSILFWKSLPISDELTVLSKVLVALILFPVMSLVTMTITTLTAMFVLCVAYAMHGISLFSVVFSIDNVWMQIGLTLKSFPVYITWALPAISWMILVSSLVKSRAGMWAILIPIGLFAITAFINDIVGAAFVKNFAYAVLFRGIVSIVPDSWSYHYYLEEYSQTLSFPEAMQHVALKVDLASWKIFATADLWLGVIAGVAMLLLAVRVRRSRGD